MLAPGEFVIWYTPRVSEGATVQVQVQVQVQVWVLVHVEPEPGPARAGTVRARGRRDRVDALTSYSSTGDDQ